MKKTLTLFNSEKSCSSSCSSSSTSASSAMSAMSQSSTGSASSAASSPAYTGLRQTKPDEARALSAKKLSTEHAASP